MTSPSSQSQELPVPPTASDLFKLGSRPAQVIEHPSWNAARDRIMSLVSGGPSLIALLGSPGSGKTTLLRDLGGKLGERGYAARLLEFADSPLGVGPAEVVLVDEADHMSATRLEALCRRSDATIRRGIASDPDAHPTDAAFWKDAAIVMPPPKTIVTIRLDADLLRWFRQQRGYQTRINAILRAYMNAQ